MNNRARVLLTLAAFATGFAVMWAGYYLRSEFWSPKPMAPEALPQSLLWGLVSAVVALLVSPIALRHLLKPSGWFAAFSKGTAYFGFGLAIVILVYTLVYRYTPKTFSEDLLSNAWTLFEFGLGGLGWFVLVVGGIVGVLFAKRQHAARALGGIDARMKITLGIVATLAAAVVALVIGYLKFGSLWDATATTDLAILDTEDATYSGFGTIISWARQGERLAVLWDTYGKDHWACYVRTASGDTGWVLCTDLQRT